MSIEPALEREVRIDATPATVYEFLTDAAKWQQWMGTEVELDMQAQQVYRIHIAGDLGPVARCELLEADPAKRVAYSWGWEGDWNPVKPGMSRVEITLTANGDGTILRLRHLGLPPGQVEFHAGGWETFLPRLAVVASGGQLSW